MFGNISRSTPYDVVKFLNSHALGAMALQVARSYKFTSLTL